MNWEYSCGAVVFSRVGGQARYVLVQQKQGFFGFPKGHMEPGETELQTARREIQEEVGLTPRFIEGFRTQVEYVLPRKENTSKRVVFFLAEYQGEPLTPQAEELLSAVALPYAQALRKLDHENSRRVLQQAHSFLQKQGMV